MSSLANLSLTSSAVYAVSISCLLRISLYWLNAVHTIVPEPYMDEVFHVGQAKTYLAGRWSEWDPKITTPPGLYVISSALARLGSDDVVYNLRALNAYVLPTLGFITLTYCIRKRPDFLTVAHTAFNICLFPPLFFFSALYYTDVISTVSVLLFWQHLVSRPATSEPTFAHAFVSILLGLFSLTFRQTNVFWVAIFPAALTVVEQGRGNTSHMSLHDPLVEDSNAYDYALLITSLITTTCHRLISDPVPLIKRIVPYAVIMTCFGSFVLWNGGVVLGDKSNHIATLHLAQMLYLWPYIAFFSLPLVLAGVLQVAINILANCPGLHMLQVYRRPTFRSLKLSTLVVLVILAVLIVRYSTVVHPFTLADNRHYVSAVFRILLRHPSIRYLAAPFYVLCGWAVVEVLGQAKNRPTSKVEDSATRDSATGQIEQSPVTEDYNGRVRISFVFAWVSTCLLQLATAPLVEPRYMIVPWIMWRLQVPSSITPNCTSRPSPKSHDPRLWFETLWFLAINAITGWVFLHRGFSWVQEPGKIQRFLW